MSDMISYDFPRNFQWFPMIFLWFSHDFPGIWRISSWFHGLKWADLQITWWRPARACATWPSRWARCRSRRQLGCLCWPGWHGNQVKPSSTLWLCQNGYGKSSSYSEFSHWTWWFSIAMLNYQRVNHGKACWFLKNKTVAKWTSPFWRGKSLWNINIIIFHSYVR